MGANASSEKLSKVMITSLEKIILINGAINLEKPTKRFKRGSLK